jgi:transposase-like protein
MSGLAAEDIQKELDCRRPTQSRVHAARKEAARQRPSAGNGYAGLGREHGVGGAADCEGTAGAEKNICPSDKGVLAGKGNVKSNGTSKIKSGERVRKFICSACETVFSSRKNTVFYGLRTSPEKITLALDLSTKGLSANKIAEVVKVCPVTVRKWKLFLGMISIPSRSQPATSNDKISL